MSFRNYYKILEVAPTATEIELKRSYRRLALMYHPDKTFGDKVSEEKFREIQAAYEVLSDKISRQNYDIEYNIEKAKYFARKQNSSAGEQQRKSNIRKEQTSQKREDQPITPDSFYKSFRNIRLSVDAADKSSINQEMLSKSLKDLLSDTNISFLISYGDIEINKNIIEEALHACEPLAIPYFEEIGIKLLKLARGENSLILKIRRVQKGKQNKSYWFAFKILFGVAVFVSLVHLSKNSKSKISTSADQNFSSSSSSMNRPSSGDVYVSATPDSANITKSKKLSSLGEEDFTDWETTKYESGNSPQCYNYIPRFNRDINNYIKVTVGSNTDAVIKVVNDKTRKCIRYIYVRSGDTYFIRHLPEGRYFLKLAYGKDWRKKIENGKCIGKFVYNALYKKGEKILDFRRVYTGTETKDGQSYKTYQIPSYSLNLNVVDVAIDDKFKSFNILENEFNDDK